jgi:hypothetical protein
MTGGKPSDRLLGFRPVDGSLERSGERADRRSDARPAVGIATRKLLPVEPGFLVWGGWHSHDPGIMSASATATGGNFMLQILANQPRQVVTLTTMIDSIWPHEWPHGARGVDRRGT